MNMWKIWYLMFPLFINVHSSNCSCFLICSRWSYIKALSYLVHLTAESREYNYRIIPNVYPFWGGKPISPSSYYLILHIKRTAQAEIIYTRNEEPCLRESLSDRSSLRLIVAISAGFCLSILFLCKMRFPDLIQIELAIEEEVLIHPLVSLSPITRTESQSLRKSLPRLYAMQTCPRIEWCQLHCQSKTMGLETTSDSETQHLRRTRIDL